MNNLEIISLYKIKDEFYGGYIAPTYAGDNYHHITINLKEAQYEIDTIVAALLCKDKEEARRVAHTAAFGLDSYNEAYGD